MRDTAQIDFHERLLGTLAIDVDGFGYQFFAGAAFASDENRGVGTCDACYGIQYFRQSARFSDDVAAVQCVGLLGGAFCLRRIQFEGCLDALQQGGVVPRLGDEVEGAGLHALYGQLDAAPGGHQYDRRFGAEYFYLFQQGKSFFAGCRKGEVHIHQYQCRSFGADGVDGFAWAWHSLYFVAGAFQHEAERRTYCAIVVNYKNHVYIYNKV